ncbi:hypothetical protein BTVI_64915 [Pitangus sulphuratus]|nr:hypothetical protein BTVI_64915 [Pitangus sulphuratus]
MEKPRGWLSTAFPSELLSREQNEGLCNDVEFCDDEVDSYIGAYGEQDIIPQNAVHRNETKQGMQVVCSSVSRKRQKAVLIKAQKGNLGCEEHGNFQFQLLVDYFFHSPSTPERHFDTFSHL